MIRQNAYGVNVSKWKSVFILRHFYWVDEGKMGSGIFSCSLLKLLKDKDAVTDRRGCFSPEELLDVVKKVIGVLEKSHRLNALARFP